MRRLRYSVAMSLDGFIGDSQGGYDWIVTDPDIDFVSLYNEFDIALMGRKTFEMAEKGPGATIPGLKTVVCSRTLQRRDFPNFTITTDAGGTVTDLKAKPGKDIWLFGGASLFRSLLDAHLVDTVEVSVVPIMLSQGIPLLPAGQRSPRLRLTKSKTLRSGIVTLAYAVDS